MNTCKKEEPELLTAKDIEKMLKICSSQAYQLLNGQVNGVSRLKVIRVGRSIRVKKDDLLRWLEENSR